MGAFGQQVGAELLKLFSSDIQDAMAAILRFFKPHLLPNHKSVGAEIWWEVSE